MGSRHFFVILAAAVLPELAYGAASFSADTSGSVSSQTINIRYGIDAADVGTAGNLYLAVGLNDQWFMQGPSGWNLLSAGALPALATGPLSDRVVPLVTNADLSCLLSATVLAGYGKSDADLVARKNYSTVFSLTNPTVSGQLYARDSRIAYAAGAPTNASTLSGTITTSKCPGTVSAGRYQVSALATGNDSYPSLDASAVGYIPTRATVIKARDNLGDVAIGLYPEVTVKPRPGFVKGVFTMDVGGFMADTYSGGYFDPTYARIKAKVGANLVANSDPVGVISYDEATNKVVMSKEFQPTGRMFTKDEYTQLVAKARANGMAFMMLLGVTNPGPQPLPWGVSSTNTAFWTAWFDAYKTIAVEYAAIARDLGIEYLSLGFNSGYMSSVPVGYWKPLVSAVRGTGYQGKIVYQAGIDMGASWGEVFGFNESCCGDTSVRDSKRAEFVSLFDYVVLNIYNVVKGRTTPPEASRDEMNDSVRWLLDQVKTYPVPVMIMVGTPSVHGGATATEYIEPCIVCNSIAPTKQRDDMQQADVYQAIAEVINESPTGNGSVAGLLTWGYWFSDDYLSWQPKLGPPFEMAYDKSASIRGKPAEAVLNWWFGRW